MKDKFPRLLDDFLSYVKMDTKSDPKSNEVPSTKGQGRLIERLKKDLDEIGMDWVILGEVHKYLYAYLAGNDGGASSSVGFIAHVDTSPEEPGENVKPKVFEYNGGIVDLADDGSVVLDPRTHTELAEKAGKTLITASGDTLLGADDKAGIAEIISGLRYLKENPSIKRSDIYIAFTPDEEIGRGTKYFDTKIFQAKYAYTFDGSGLGGYEEENFNAVNGNVIFKGFNTHPGSAYKRMINAVRASAHFVSGIEERFTPEGTKGREGFIHFDAVKGNVNSVEVEFIIRDFRKAGIQRFKNDLLSMKKQTMELFKGLDIQINFVDAYENMKEIIDKSLEVRRRAESAAKRAGIDLKQGAIRGGTDGARLSYMGIPTPNVFTGGYNYHSKYEFAVLEEMNTAVDFLIELARGGVE